jgi:hypothetical protein
VFPELKLDVGRYGAALDGVTNDYTAWVKAFAVAAAAGGGRILCRGNSAIASASLTTTGLVIPSNVEILFPSRTCGITITGSTACILFTPLNARNIAIRGGFLTGNSQGADYVSGHAMVFTQNASAVAAGDNIVIDDVTLSNFRAAYWLWFVNSGATHALKNIHVSNCRFLSQNGNSIDPTDIGQTASCVAFQGASANTVGLVQDCVVHHNYCDANFIKNFGTAWHSTLRIRFHHNTVLRAGQAGANADRGGYAFLIYDNSGGAGGARPDLVYVEDNIVTDPRSAGLYVADANRIYARRNRISGQADTNDASLPKGAIAVNGALYAEVLHNDLEGNYVGIALYQAAVAAQIVAQNRIKSTVASATGIRLRGTFAGKAGSYECIGNSIDLTGATSVGIDLMFQAGNGISRLVVKNNPLVRATSRCVTLTSPDASTPDVQFAEISGNTLAGNGASVGLSWTNASDSQTRALIQNNNYIGTWASAWTTLDIRESRGLTVRNETFHDHTSGTGFAIATTRAQGRLEGIRFVNVSTARRFVASGSGDLGVDAPTWTGAHGDFVQDLAALETAVAASKDTRQGWLHDGAAWRETRSLTVN